MDAYSGAISNRNFSEQAGSGCHSLIQHYDRWSEFYLFPTVAYGTSSALAFPDAKMSGNRQIRMQPAKWLGLSLMCLVIAALIPLLTWFALADDSHLKVDKPIATRFQFARLRYPGGIPNYIKNW